ncbi:hypothetical protein D9V84_04600 [Bacteroidetes/Chlorobi group bacterium Naka2016]|jgi:uncharacterized protein (TIGR00725 family)|nr:MAG: hypothetical protein D9V84_04600 [Bacteroidetes/Chlorobi group bacterium Naka2016]
MKTAVIFGSGNCSSKSKLYKDAMALGELLARKGYNIANGGYSGVMEGSAKGAAKFNVERIGVVFKNYKSLPNRFLTQIIESNSYLQRLEKLISLGDLFFILEGGSGTLLELAALLALKERKLKKAQVFCVGRKWQKILHCLGKKLKINLDTYFTFVDDVKSLNDFISL